MDRAQPLRLELSPSVPLALLTVAVHGTAAACLLGVLPGWPGPAAGFLVAALGLAAAWDRALLRSPSAPRTLELRASGEGVCEPRTGPPAIMRRPGAGSVTRYWVALPLAAGNRRSLLVVRGMLEPDAFRQLRLWARWGRLPGVAPRQRAAGAGAP